MKTIHLEAKETPKHLRNAFDYSGHKFQIRVADSVEVGGVDAYWSGGTRSQFALIHLGTGKTMPHGQNVGNGLSPRNATVRLHGDNVAVVEHTIFCGKDLGLTFHIHPNNAAELLPAPEELTAAEKIVLSATRSLKASYGGKSRLQMVNDYKPIISKDDWEAATEDLKARKLLNARGAITAAGKNAVGNDRSYEGY